ncbi:hypothetical protein Y032_0016g3162 [Ancylostoma ceylanicum]|uniref:Uncharacterized protein n=1 Tax=Ancylostoma ceylanicum TaxID=53326 RepID=A0A016V8X9_9BILA|nr:hypothetical protein Y032_0016g3162 [Ancylostoma ceylanicum]
MSHKRLFAAFIRTGPDSTSTRKTAAAYPSRKSNLWRSRYSLVIGKHPTHSEAWVTIVYSPSVLIFISIVCP